jgi:hypothetical protein
MCILYFRVFKIGSTSYLEKFQHCEKAKLFSINSFMNVSSFDILKYILEL